MIHYIEEVKTKVRLQEGVQVIEQLLVASYMRPGISTKELARHTYLPVPVASAIKKELIKAGALIQDRGCAAPIPGSPILNTSWGMEASI